MRGPVPPHADLQLEERILKAAQRLWKSRGPASLTLRAVAREAGTTTPTVYKRFKNKQALSRALADRVRSQLNESLFASKSLKDVCRRYLNFVHQNPHEYQLLLHAWSDVFHPELPRPGRSWLMQQFANRFGGDPQDYSLVTYALIMLSHGAATVLSIPGDEIARKEVEENFLKISDRLIEHNEILKG